MAATSDGLNGFFGTVGAHYINELKRRAAQMLVETSAPAGDPRTVSVLRMEQDDAGNLALGISPSWSQIAGLANLEAAVITAAQWAEQPIRGVKVELKDADRVIIIADVPLGGLILPSDRIQYTDPVYGEVVFDVIESLFDDGANICRVLVKYAKED